MTQLHDLSATEQVAAVAARDVSSRELVEHYLDRIDRLDGDLACYVTVLADHARASAAAADAALARGEDLGLLHGLPLALKDMHAAAGLPTSFGSAVLQGLVPAAEGPAVANLRGAGAVVLGRTNVPEFGPTCYTDNAVRGMTRNPYDLGATPSGSSGGSAAAVAAGLAPVAHASDGLGSIRTPAAACGLVGLKTTRGRSAGSGTGFLALGVEGPVARTVADTALLLDAMGGPSASDLWHSGVVAPEAFRVASRTPPPAALRIGRLVHAPAADVEVDPVCVAAVDRALGALQHAGHAVEEVAADRVATGPEVRDAVRTVLGVTMTQIAEAAVAPEQRHLLMPYTRWLIETCTASAIDYARAQAVLAAAATRFAALVDGYDLLVTPTTTAPPPTNAHLRADDAAASFEAMGRWSAFTPAVNLAGLPAVSLPVDRTPDGVPLGVQLVGRRHGDELLVSLAAQLEAVFGWQSVHPPAWAA